MTTTVQTASNPFALMMDPESVFAAIARSERLARLSSRICRPLDKPFVVPTDAAAQVAEASFEVEEAVPESFGQL